MTKGVVEDKNKGFFLKSQESITVNTFRNESTDNLCILARVVLEQNVFYCCYHRCHAYNLKTASLQASLIFDIHKSNFNIFAQDSTLCKFRYFQQKSFGNLKVILEFFANILSDFYRSARYS